MDDDIVYEPTEAQEQPAQPMPFRRKIVEIQRRLRAPKNQWNGFGKYSYRNCEDILEALKPLLSEYGVLVKITDEIVVIGDRFYVKATAEAYDVETSDSIHTVAYAREPENKKGSDQSQVTGSCSSYARKYALSGLFLVDDNKDSDVDMPVNEQKPQHVQQSGGFDAYCVNCGTGYHFDGDDQYMQFVSQLPSNPCCANPSWQVVR